MLEITLTREEGWDEKTEEFLPDFLPEKTITLHHSLKTISKWEAKHHRCFLRKGKDGKLDLSDAELDDYILCMIQEPDVDELTVKRLTVSQRAKIYDYMTDQACATVLPPLPPEPNSGTKDTMTAELIYYWMICQNVPFSCEDWHINRLITFIELCSRKNRPPKSYSPGAISKHNAALNKSRRAAWRTRG